jgi:hypothetical protein
MYCKRSVRILDVTNQNISCSKLQMTCHYIVCFPCLVNHDNDRTLLLVSLFINSSAVDPSHSNPLTASKGNIRETQYHLSRVMAQAVSCRLFKVEVRVHSQASP